jgi:hypothetical protein
MTDRRAVAVLLVGVALFAGLSAPAGATAAPDAPVTVNSTYVGGDADAEHAYRVTVTVAPAQESGAINDTLLTVSAGEAAFISSGSVATSQTTGGSQVITRVADRPAEFRLDRIEPGETATVSFRVYPNAVLPTGETLATVGVETQFVRTQRVVTETRTVAPTLRPAEVRFATDPPVPPLISGGAGTAVAVVVLGGAAVFWRRRLYRSLRGSLRSARAQAVSTEAEREIATALRRVGGESDGGDDSGSTDSGDIGGDDLTELNMGVED